MEPLVPTSGRGELAELSVEIFRKSGELAATLPSRTVRSGVAELVREMNSYYSNLIEGHKTLPRDIERALRDDFSDCEDDRRNQLLSVAHVRAETAMRRRIAEQPETSVFQPEFIQWLHREFYQSLPPEEWFTTSLSGKRHPLEPGKFRAHNVDVGRHTPPDHEVLGDFMHRFDRFYSDPVWRWQWQGGTTAIPSGHDPFLSGYGRTVDSFPRTRPGKTRIFPALAGCGSG
jgi:Fic family protein